MDDAEDAGPASGRFVHLDVLTAHSPWCSPSTPEQYVQALGAPVPDRARSDDQPRPAMAIADYGLHSAVKTAVACDRAGIDHIVGLRVRVVPERAYRTWGERAGELILLAMDETGWLSLVGLDESRFSGGADRGRPRVDWRDLETFSEGVIALTGMPGGGGILSAAIEHSANPAEPIEAYGLVRRLMDLYPGRLYLELAFHGNAAEKLVNRGLVAIAQRMELPLVATNAVRFARPDDALAHKVLEAIGRGTRADGVLGHTGRDGYDLPTLTVEAVRAQAYLKTPKQMWRAFGQLPAALQATRRDRRALHVPPAAGATANSRDEPAQPLGPGLLFGLEPARELGEQQLGRARGAGAARALRRDRPRRAVRRGARARATRRSRTICERGLADLLLFAHEVGQFCAQHGIPLAARGSATSSLVVWALGLVGPVSARLRPRRADVRPRRPRGPARPGPGGLVTARAGGLGVRPAGRLRGPARARRGRVPAPARDPRRRPRQHGRAPGVRAVGAALGMEAPRVNAWRARCRCCRAPARSKRHDARARSWASPTRAPASSRTTRSCASPASWRACRTATARTRRRTPSRSTDRVCWTGCRRSG